MMRFLRAAADLAVVVVGALILCMALVSAMQLVTQTYAPDVWCLLLCVLEQGPGVAAMMFVALLVAFAALSLVNFGLLYGGVRVLAPASASCRGNGSGDE
jgi:hypothetical protein